MTVIKIEVKDCSYCPFSESHRYYTADSWEHAENYYCKKMPAEPAELAKREQHTDVKSRKIAGYIERPSEMPGVPVWCPLRLDAKEAVAAQSKSFVEQHGGENI